jgi:hypothetical protein
VLMKQNIQILLFSCNGGYIERFCIWLSEHYGYHCSIRPMNQKAWIEVKSPRFSYLPPILYLVVMELGAKLVLSPTNQYPVQKINHCDIVFISQL